MIDFFYSIDVAVFFFINHTIANPLFDLLLPFITDLNKNKAVTAIIVLWVLFVLWKGGKTGRITVAILLITVIVSDQLNSSVLKGLFGRIRPCRVLQGVRMLVDCGGGLSFPSSHAVNNFAAAAVISHFYRRQKLYWFSFASLVALSRTYVGVHYPSDIVAGALIGIGIGMGMTALWEMINNKLEKRHLSMKVNNL